MKKLLFALKLGIGGLLVFGFSAAWAQKACAQPSVRWATNTYRTGAPPPPGATNNFANGGYGQGERIKLHPNCYKNLDSGK